MSCLDVVLLITGNEPTYGKDDKSSIVDLVSVKLVSNKNK